ncbi:MAG: beta-lactamase family protein, partial [Caldilineaceae bacterium]|nr:beta-lactamase family protein [Caldilineaceae bacterium]
MPHLPPPTFDEAGRADRIAAALPELDAIAAEFANKHKLPALAYGVVAGGSLVHGGATGWADIAAQQQASATTLFRIASMTKPITSLAALMLWEEGRFALSDPISRWAPEFTHMRVLRTRSGPVGQTAPAQRPITFEDLLTHRAGFSYADFEQGPIAQAYAEALGGNIDNDIAPDDWMARLASLPLIDQPGAAFHYSHATDLLGLLMARMEDAPLGDVLERRIFGPLGMKDTAFTVAQEKRSRCAALHGFDEAGHLTVLPHVPGNHALPERPADMRFV